MHQSSILNLLAFTVNPRSQSFHVLSSTVWDIAEEPLMESVTWSSVYHHNGSEKATVVRVDLTGDVFPAKHLALLSSHNTGLRLQEVEVYGAGMHIRSAMPWVCPRAPMNYNMPSIIPTLDGILHKT